MTTNLYSVSRDLPSLKFHINEAIQYVTEHNVSEDTSILSIMFLSIMFLRILAFLIERGHHLESQKFSR